MRASIRSLLYVPGNRTDLFAKADRTEADVIILDLEDAVAASAKHEALSATCRAIGNYAGHKRLFVRINDGVQGLDDVAALAHASKHLDTLLIPKAEGGASFERLVACTDRLPSTVGLQPIVETVSGLYSMRAVCDASPRVVRFSFGAGDFVADIGARHSDERSETLLARSTLVLESRLLRLKPPIAHVAPDFRDHEKLRRISAEDRALGFGGRACIHPAQVPIVNAEFGISESERERALLIVARFEAMAVSGVGSFTLDDGTFVDEAVAKLARASLG
ncbi:CoA ester lyase [Sphingomonas sp. PAMC26645]|uniref:HpcH/HpaI aldolase/citrate lyase family protein n=1 Tax=Sphingomonas sp. PAMC26645 TaxID=2565555 RepID=UPI00109DCF74|nr:CoA ester lyase [Sphingomonas sp. PAMC26645]QCB43271.1 CoA ester lyase [Sphingomonas sp. PAMC26645]